MLVKSEGVANSYTKYIHFIHPLVYCFYSYLSYTCQTVLLSYVMSNSEIKLWLIDWLLQLMLAETENQKHENKYNCNKWNY